MAPVLGQRWCDSCGQLEITVVFYDDLGTGHVVWVEQVHAYRPLVLFEHFAAAQGIGPDEILDAKGPRP